MNKNTLEGFLEYIEEHVDFIGILRTVDGTTYMDICGFDGGDIYYDGLEDGPKFENPETIDSWMKETVEYFQNKGIEVEMPELSFTDFCQMD